MKSNAELIDEARLGNRQAYGELLTRYERAVWATAWHVLRDFHASQDVTQETFLQAHRNLSELRTPDAVGPWLLRIAWRLALRVVKARRADIPISEIDVAAPRVCTELTSEQSELIGALGQLPEHERLVTVLYYLNGHPVAEVAKLTGRPVGTVTKQLSRAVGRLKIRFERLISD
jgi:RNA polymerase sigma-70 factor (ECF subfamily)